MSRRGRIAAAAAAAAWERRIAVAAVDDVVVEGDAAAGGRGGGGDGWLLRSSRTTAEGRGNELMRAARAGMHKYSLGGRPAGRGRPSFVPSFLSILTSITSIFIGSGINRTEQPCWAAAAECNARTHASTAKQQNKRKEGIKEGRN